MIFLLCSLILLSILLLLNRFGVAERFANLWLIFSLALITYQIFKLTKKNSLPASKDYPSVVTFGLIITIIATILIYGFLLFKGPAVWGDAPYYHPDVFKNFSLQPLVWESRGRLGVVNDLYFLYPIMVIYNLLGTFGLNNDLIIRLVFYFPALFLSLLGSWQFSRYLGYSSLVSLFASTIYLLNTYLILIIDGGQVGVALAFGLFPLTLLHLHKLVSKQTIQQFARSLVIFMFIVMADVRFAIISIMSFLIWKGFQRQNLKILLLFGLSVLALSSYWIIPLLVLEPTTGSGIRSDLKLINVLHPLFLVSPHWPFNEFGKIFPPPWFFAGLPILIFLNLFFKKQHTIFLIFNFLLFVFLAKGGSGFLGSIYATVVDTIPMGGAFRDSSKFFAPLLLYAGILVGISVESLSQIFKKNFVSKAVIGLILIYTILVLYPAVSGNMHGVLAKREFPKDMQVIADKLSSEESFLRTLWFPDRHPLSYYTEEKPLLDAKVLVSLRPFASLNVGSGDKFNFLHQEQFLQWFDLFGIKYLFFPGDTRKVIPDEAEDRDWSKLVSIVDSIEGLERVSWDTRFPIYQTQSYKPRVFAVDKLIAVIGGEDIYQKLIDADEEFSISKQGFVFFEDGKLDPKSLQIVSSESAVLVFNNKEKTDLVMSFLVKFFGHQEKSSQWARRSSSEYLKWRFELLVNKLPTSEFDYGKGIVFSSQPNEKLVFDLEAPNDGRYILALRHMSASGSGNLQISFAGKDDQITSSVNHFKWFTKEVDLKSGDYNLIITNPQGFQVVNTTVLVPITNWQEANSLTEKLLSKFMVVNENLNNFSSSDWQQVDYKMVSTTQYDIQLNRKMRWLIFSDSYNQHWKLKHRSTLLDPVPFYSIINGFYIEDFQKGSLVFDKQWEVNFGVILSLISLAIISVILTYGYFKT